MVKVAILITLLILEGYNNFTVCLPNNRTYVPIKVIYEVAKGNSFGIVQPGNDFQNLVDGGKKKTTKSSLQPAQFTGPQQLKELIGQCFTLLDAKYRYQLCPFQNITQEEIQFASDPYKGILGTWGEWIIKNNSFSAMYYIEGSRCGSGISRNAKIYLKCSHAHRFTKIEEPTKCVYEGVFETPFVCGHNSKVVYPRLKEELQFEWDKIKTEKHFGILTSKGYEEELKRLFLKAGFLLSPDAKKSLNAQSSSDPRLDCEEIRTALEKRINELQDEIARRDTP